MLEDEYTITQNTLYTGRVQWETDNASDVSWFFKNGKFLYGPFFDDVTERDTLFAFETGNTVQGELHHFIDENTIPDSMQVQTNTVPKLSWNAVSDAVEYRVYHKETVTGDETLIVTVDATAQSHYYIDCPLELNGHRGVWHFFRVESVDQYENVSTRESWLFWVYDVPDPVSLIEISNGSGAGLFDIELTT